MDKIYKEILRLQETGQTGALCTIVHSQGSAPRHTGSKMLVYQDGNIIGSVGGGEIESRVIQEALQAISDGKTRMLKYSLVDPKRGDVGICGGQVEVFVEPIVPAPLLVVVGGGHVGKAVAHLAKWLGFRVAVSDDRAEFCNPDAVPDADEFYNVPLEELPKYLNITPSTYLVLTTRGLMVDVPGLPALLDTPAAYIGVIGSKRRWIFARKKIIESGIPEEKLAKVYSPIGLDINAETPEEIAVSIMAEVIMRRNGGTGKSLKM